MLWCGFQVGAYDWFYRQAGDDAFGHALRRTLQESKDRHSESSLIEAVQDHAGLCPSG